MTMQQQLVVGLGEMAVSTKAERPIVALGLGSCVAVVLSLAHGGVAGMAHIVLPKADPHATAKPPAYYANLGVPRLAAAMQQQGVSVATGVRVRLIGGASIGAASGFDVGKKNLLAVRRELFRAGLAPVAEAVGGSIARSVYVDVGLGRVFIEREPGERIQL